MSKKLNHSRHIDYYAKDISNNIYWSVKKKPTAKQIKFYNKLYALCKKNNVDTKTDRYTVTRSEYAENIDILLNRLIEAGVDVNGNEKEVRFCMKIGEDRRGRFYAREGLEIVNNEEIKILDESKIYCCDMCKKPKNRDKEIAWLTPKYGICLDCYYSLTIEDRKKLEKEHN